jgi:ubiquinone/menaquinone biosynthesis C-methylase UbiE
MDSVDRLKETFIEVSLEVEDLFLLEGFQVGYLPERLPEQELAAVLWAYPSIKQFLVKKHPPIAEFIGRIMAQSNAEANPHALTACCDKVVWSISDLLVYNKFPEVYDTQAFHNWNFHKVVTSTTPLEDRMVIDGGAGTGRVALEAAQTAAQVFAIEPVSRLRQFIRAKAAGANLKNLFVVDGFLHDIPLPDGFADVLITSQAIGWRLEDELEEIERVVKKGGAIIHRPGAAEDAIEIQGDENLHRCLTSSKWQYEFTRYEESDGWKIKYWKQV